MRLGIDFGTTRVVVAAVDRGNYPVIQFDTGEGFSADWFPPWIAARAGEFRYGWRAWAARTEPGWAIVRSVKRLLGDAGPNTLLEIGEQGAPMGYVLGGMTAELARHLREQSTLELAANEPLEIYLGVPANANTNQRFLTSEAFRRSGYRVLGLLNEPSAASIEYSHRNRLTPRAEQNGYLLVYDLGGGTFDASLVELAEKTHTVAGTEGISTLGGDDFDDVLAELALDAAGVSEERRDAIAPPQWTELREVCRERKEALHPNTRKIAVDLESAGLSEGEVSVAASDFYERCQPLVDETLHAVNDLLARHGLESGDGDRFLEAVYVCGGGSELPLVPRDLRERFGRRVKRSAHGHTATAIGLAIRADQAAGYEVHERFTRHFGVWREARAGEGIAFDPLFEKGTPLPPAGEPPLIVERRYRPAHNVGHFRYLECSALGGDGQPGGDLTFWDEIRFPFDPGLEAEMDLSAAVVERLAGEADKVIEEVYRCDAGGAVSVTMKNLTSGHIREYPLGKWSADDKPVKAARRPRKKKASK